MMLVLGALLVIVAALVATLAYWAATAFTAPVTSPTCKEINARRRELGMGRKPSKRSALLLTLAGMAVPTVMLWRDVGSQMLSAGDVQ